jgi:MarR family transcriptional regulator, lower aerobic nicotinate degradation pathway regulator
MKRRIRQNKQHNSLAAEAQARAVQHDTPTMGREPPLPESLARWTGNLLYWVANMGAEFYAEAVAPFGVTPAQVAILQVVAYEGAMRQARISDRTRIDKATMVGLLNDLEGQGLIERRPAPNDGRAFDIYMLEAGHERLRTIEQASLAADEQFFGVLSPQEQRTFRELLERLAKRTEV